eukprot:scaffold14807_cov66-Phaeocystis_antarctica.AAC.2
MMHRRTITTSVSAVSKSPPGRPPRSPAAALVASATAPAAAPGSLPRVASRSTRAAPSRSSRCVGRPRTTASRHPADGTTPPRTRRRCRTGFQCGQTSGSRALPLSDYVLSHDASQDQNNHRIRRVDIATGATTTLAGSGTAGFRNGAGGSAQFQYPRGIAIEPSGGYALVAVRAPLA